jgi:hypothetical protein
MKEILKKDLLAKLNESSIEMDEMSKYNPGREEKNPWDETPEERAERQRFERRSVVKSYRFEKPPVGTKQEDMPPVDVFIYNPSKEPTGRKTAVVPSGLVPITEEEFASQNPKFYEWAKKEMEGGLHLVNVKKVQHDPLQAGKATPSPQAIRLRQQTGLDFGEKEGTSIPERERILRYTFNPLVREYLITDGVNTKLIESGFPPLKMPDQMFKGQKASIDRHSKISNQGIEFGGHNYDFYLSIADFAKANEDRLYNESPSVDILTTHMPRQYNMGANWDALRPTENMDTNYKNDPLTALLKLPKRGYRPEDRDIAVGTSISIKGKLSQSDNGLSYEWTVDFSTQLGKKLRDEMRVAGNNRQQDKNFTCSETSETFSSEWTKDNEGRSVYKSIVERPEVRQAFIDCLKKVSNDILNMDVTEELESRSVVDRSDITKRMNENKIAQLVIDAIKNMNK